MESHTPEIESSCPTPITTPASQSSQNVPSPLLPLGTNSQTQVESEQGISAPAPAAPRKPRSLTSEVWNHFEKIIVNGEEKAECMYCHKKFSANSRNGTSHLKDHLKLRCVKKV